MNKQPNSDPSEHQQHYSGGSLLVKKPDGTYRQLTQAEQKEMTLLDTADTSDKENFKK